MSAETDQLFSGLSDLYARHRPQYPPALYAWLSKISPSPRRAWDCGAGSGQAAVGLSAFFEHVAATDVSFSQLARAARRANISYVVGRDSAAPFSPGSISLVTAATAVHWFDLDRFYAEVRRVARPQAVLAVWSYHLLQIEPEIDALTARYYSEILGPYWAPQMQYHAGRYRSLPFPFEEIAAPEFEMQVAWDVEAVLGFLKSWSATVQFTQARGYHPLDEIEAPLRRLWGPPERVRRVRWPLFFRVGRI